MCNKNEERKIWIERYQSLIGVILSGVFVSVFGIYLTHEYNKQQLEIEHIKLFASTNPQTRAFAYLSYYKNINEDEVIEIIKLNYDSSSLVTLNYMMNNKKNASRVKDVISALPIQIYLYRAANQKNIFAEEVKKKFESLGHNEVISNVKKDKDEVPEIIEIRYFKEDESYLAGIIWRQLNSIKKSTPRNKIIYAEGFQAKRGTIEIWFPPNTSQ